MGLYNNLASVLGGNPLLWLLPVGAPLGDGLLPHLSLWEDMKTKVAIAPYFLLCRYDPFGITCPTPEAVVHEPSQAA